MLEKSQIKKIKLSLIDIGGIIGAIMILVGVYFVDFLKLGNGIFSVSGNLFSLPDKIRIIMNGLGELASLFGSSSKLENFNSAITELNIVIFSFTIAATAIIFSGLVKDKRIKILGLGFSIFSLIVDMILNSKVSDLLKTMGQSSSGAPGGWIIFIGIVLSLVFTGIAVFKSLKEKM